MRHQTDSHSPEEIYMAKEILLKVWDDLDKVQKEIFLAYLCDDQEVPTIAKEHNITTTQVYYAIKSIEKKLKGQLYG